MKWLTTLVLLISLQNTHLSFQNWFSLDDSESVTVNESNNQTQLDLQNNEADTIELERDDEAFQNDTDQDLFTLSSTYLSLGENESVYFEIILNDQSIDQSGIQITYSQTNVAQIDLVNKQVHALGPGQVTVTITLNGQQKTLTVNVQETTAAIKFNETTFYLIRDLSYEIPYTITPESLKDKPITWNSSNTSVASVENGKVVGYKIGKTIITATVDGSSASMELFVTAPLEGLSFPVTSIQLGLGETSDVISVILKPTDTTDNVKVKYTIADESIVMFNDDHQLVALKEGTTKVTASYASFKAEVVIVVKQVENDRGLIEVELDEKIFGANQLQYSMDKLNVQKNKKYSIILPSEKILEALTTQEVVNVSILIDQTLLSNDFAKLEEFVLSSDILKNIENKQVIVTIKNNFGVTYARYTFCHKSSNDVDLRYSLTAFYKGSSLGNLVGTDGYHLVLNNAQSFPLQTTLAFPAASLGARDGINRYLYVYHAKTNDFEATTQTVSSDESDMMVFTLEQMEYLITDSKVSLRNNDYIYIVFGGLSIAVVGGSGIVYYKDRKKSKLS